MIKEYFEKRAMKKLVATLGPALRRRYGGSGPYTFEQVQRTIEDLRLNKKYADFAYFIFCDESSYEKWGFHLKEIKKYRGYRDRFYEGSCGGGSGFRNEPGEGSCGSGGD